MPRKLSASTVYRRAAQRIENDDNNYTCVAIMRVVNPEDDDMNASKSLRDAYVQMFTDGTNDFALQALIERGAHWDMEERRNLRVLLLCMMAAVTGYKPRRKAAR
jgi:hypothetical protein